MRNPRMRMVLLLWANTGRKCSRDGIPVKPCRALIRLRCGREKRCGHLGKLLVKEMEAAQTPNGAASAQTKDTRDGFSDYFLST